MGPFPVLLILAASYGIVHSQDCPALYRRYCKEHTYCKQANPSCRIAVQGVSDADKEVILKAHNDYRSRVAMGRETTGPLPPASDMLQMVWNDELAAIAQQHANQCQFEHDSNECREVQDYPVGQNLYTHQTTATGNLKINWKAAVESWNSEIADFEPANVDSIESVPDRGDTGHLTQDIWAKSWQVGCGYVLYEDVRIDALYTCNYGPAGNVQGSEVYQAGKSCSKCPENTCCGSSCSSKPNYEGLCQVLSNKIPVYPQPKSDYIYFCDFQDLSKCQLSSVEGSKPWQVYNTLSGAYAGIVLKGGESSTLKFMTTLKAVSKLCVSLYYRKGPNVAGQKGSSVAKQLFQVLPNGSKFDIDLKRDSKSFMKFKLFLPHNKDLSFAIEFSVDDESPDQYFEITEVVALSGDC